MKKLALLCLVLLLCLSACSLRAEEEEPFSAAFTIRPRESATEVYYDVPLPSESVPAVGTTLPDADHTLRLEDLRSLMTQSMFGEKADAVACLWTTQVRYTLRGDFTEDDRTALSSMAQDLVQIAAFPGMRETEDKTANVIVRFTDAPTAQLTYQVDANKNVTSGEITIPSVLPASRRDALLQEKMFRLFGFFYAADTPLDSVLAEKPAASLTEADLIVLETVYGQFQAGMTRDDAVKAFSDPFLYAGS